MDRRKGAFLARLWQIQAEANLTDAALAREIGVQQSTVYRAKHAPDRTFGLDFALKACDRYPELGVFLLSESPPGTMSVPGRTEECAS